MNPTYQLILFIIIGVLILALFIWNFFFQRRLKNLNYLREIFFKGDKAKDLEEVIIKQKQDIRSLVEEINQLHLKINNTRHVADQGLQKIGMIRYNTFKNDGGKQSFSLALLNRKNNGVIFSGLNSRDGGRIYTKPVSNLASEYTLSEEEKRALDKASGT
jgi:hypothetical protein